MANRQIFNNTLIITGSVTASQGFYGDGSNITGVVTSSYATTSSYAFFAVSSSHEITFEMSSSHALRADAADSVTFEDITGKPTLISSSLQFDDLNSPFTGSFTGSFVGDGSGLTGVVKGTGTTNFFPIWSDGTNRILQDSQLQQSDINGSGTYVWTFNNTDRVIIDKPSSITAGDPEYLITQDGNYKFSMGWDDDGAGFGYFYNWSGNGIRLGAQGANPVLEILTDNTDPRVYINGKAGIGTDQPNNELTVKGIANITGSLEVTGSVVLDTGDSTATALSIKNGLIVLDLTNLPDISTMSIPEINQLPFGTLLRNGNILYIKDQNY
jgi:hypothetical protein